MAYTGIGARVKSADRSNSILSTYYSGMRKLVFESTIRMIPDMPRGGKDVLIAGNVRSLLKPAETTLNFNALGTTDLTDTKVTLSPVAFQVKKPQTWAAIRLNDWFTDEWGTEPAEIVKNREFVTYMSESYGDGMVQDYERIKWMGDIAAATTPAGYLKVGVDLDDYTPLDGWWKQIFAGVTATTIQRETIAANTQLTLALQESTYTAALVYATLSGLYYKADQRLLYSEKHPPFFLLTDFMVRRLGEYYDSNMITAGFVSAAQAELYPGAALMFRGIPVYAMPVWDRFIVADTKSMEGGATTAVYYRHRALLTNNDNLILGEVQGPDTGMNSIRVEHVSGTTSAMFMGQAEADVKIGSHSFFVAAY